jgi:hypothetical protein
MTTNTANLKSKLKIVGLLILGAIVFGLHIAIFKINQQLFTILICTYVIIYTILVITVLYKNYSTINNTQANLLINLSFYTIFLEIFIILLTVIYMFYIR